MALAMDDEERSLSIASGRGKFCRGRWNNSRTMLKIFNNFK